MRKTAVAVLFALLLLISGIAAPAAAADRLPRLTAISFKNAVIDQKFSSDRMTYTVTLADNTVSPTLASYTLDGDCELFIEYIYNEAKQQTGITATIEYPTGSTIYTFRYANPASYKKNGNNLLSKLECRYAELSPQLNEKDTQYKLYIPKDLTRLSLYPVMQDTNAYCAQAPIDITLNEEQELAITLDCTASDGSIRQYTLTVVRSEKTLDEVKREMEKNGSASLIKGTRFYEKEEFRIILLSVTGGLLLLLLLYRLTRRKMLNPYDDEEPAFFAEPTEIKDERQ